MRAILLALLLLPCYAADDGSNLEYVRSVNLEYAAKLPDFVADEITTRYTSRAADSQAWKQMDHIEAEIAVRGKGGFARRNVRLNEKPWSKPFPRWNWGVAFGDEVQSLFEPKCQTVIEAGGLEEFQGKPVISYRFHAPADACFGYWVSSGRFFSKKVNPPRSGRFLVDRSTGSLLRFDVQAIGFPKNFGFDTWTVSSTWGEVRIGDQSYLLPVAMEMVTGSQRGQLDRTVVEYKNHRHFESSANINFQNQ